VAWDWRCARIRRRRTSTDGKLASFDDTVLLARDRILLHDAQAVLDADTIRRVENPYGAVVLRGALRRAIRAGVIQPLPLKTLALMLTGAIFEGCMAIAHADDPNQAREDVGNVLASLLEGLRPQAKAASRSSLEAIGHFTRRGDRSRKPLS
jgi:hypothetical protein